VRQFVLAHPDATLPAYAAYLAGATGVRLSPSHLSRVLARLGLRLKKASDCGRAG
jgi:transposase